MNCNIRITALCSLTCQMLWTLHQHIRMYSDMGLVINASKGEILYQWCDPSLEVPYIEHDGVILKTTNEFVYLGGVLTSDCQVDSEVDRGICKASVAFAMIWQRVISNHNLRLPTKLSVYECLFKQASLYCGGYYHIQSTHQAAGALPHPVCARYTWSDMAG